MAICKKYLLHHLKRPDSRVHPHITLANGFGDEEWDAFAQEAQSMLNAHLSAIDYGRHLTSGNVKVCDGMIN